MSIKKAVVGAVAVLSMGMFSAASAVDVSAGVGLLYVGDYGGGLGGQSYTYTYAGSTNEYMISYPYNAYGLNAFLDVTYAEISASYVFGTAKYTYSLNGTALAASSYNNSVTFLNFGILGKYPLPMDNLPDNMTVYPAFGLEYRLALDVEDLKDASEWFSALYINIGAIYDQALNEKMFLRGKALFGLGLPTKYSNETNDAWSDASPAWGYGLTVGVAMGIKF